MKEDYFKDYVKPTINPKLSEFCVHLTGITQVLEVCWDVKRFDVLQFIFKDKVDNAETFPSVLAKANEWMNRRQLGTAYTFAIATDG